VVHRVNQTGLSSNAIGMKQDRIHVYEKLLTNLPVSPEQAHVIRTLIGRIQGEISLDQMKSALAVGDYDTARRLAHTISEMQNNWKVHFTRILMRMAPRLMRWIFLYRARLMGDRTFSIAPLGTTEPDARDNARTTE
jgi:hypothetical protein